MVCPFVCLFPRGGLASRLLETIKRAELCMGSANLGQHLVCCWLKTLSCVRSLAKAQYVSMIPCYTLYSLLTLICSSSIFFLPFRDFPFAILLFAMNQFHASHDIISTLATFDNVSTRWIFHEPLNAGLIAKRMNEYSIVERIPCEKISGSGYPRWSRSFWSEITQLLDIDMTFMCF